MRATSLMAVLAIVVPGAAYAAAADYVYSDAFERRVCDGIDCMYCSPLDPQPLCGTHSHCLPQQDATSMCTYPDGSGITAALCSDNTDCAGPFACIQAQNQACRKWCELPSGTCPPASACVGLIPPAMIGAQEWGVCL